LRSAPPDPALDTLINCIDYLRDASHVRNWRADEWLVMLGAAGFARAHVIQQFAVPLDGQEWVQRMRTPAPKVDLIRRLLTECTPAQRQAFGVRSDDPWGFSIHVVLVEASRPV